MTDRSVGTTNPLYEKLSARFSYDGKTVGEMMLARARQSAPISGTPNASLCDVTAESSITMANFLPRAGAAEMALRRPARPCFSWSRINPSAALAVVLAFFIITYLFVAGISHHTDFTTPDVLSASAIELENVENTDTTLQNP